MTMEAVARTAGTEHHAGPVGVHELLDHDGDHRFGRRTLVAW